MIAAHLWFRSGGGGNVQIEDAGDTVVATTACGAVSANFSGQPKGDCRLTSSGGDIRAKLADKLAFEVDACANGGEVTTELPITTTLVGERMCDSLRGKLNGGGKSLFLKTSSGSITIRKL